MPLMEGLMKKIVVFLLAVIAIIFYLSHAFQSEREKNVVYLFGNNGDYLKIDLDTKSVIKKGNLAQLDEVKQHLPAYNDVGPLIFASKYNAIMNRVYLLTPLVIDLASSVAPDKRKYQLLSIQLPEFNVVGQLVIGKELGYPPSILITSDGKTLLVNYKKYEDNDKGEMVTSMLEFRDAESMKKIDEIVETANSQDVVTLKVYLNNAFGPDATFQANDTIVNDGLNSIQIDVAKRKMSKHRVIRYNDFMDNYLTELQRQQLSKYAVLNERTGKEYPKIFRVGQFGNTITTVSYKSELSTGTLIVSDRESKKSKLFDVTFTPASAQLHLTPDGKYIIAESFELRKKNDGYGNETNAVFRAGRISIYSADNGKLVNQINDSPLNGFDVRVICTLKDDQNTTLYQAKDEIYVLSPVGGTLHEVEGVSDVDVSALKCI